LFADDRLAFLEELDAALADDRDYPRLGVQRAS
jgi:hypothetical protein